MRFQIPTVEELQHVGAALNTSLSTAEAEQLLEYLEPMAATYHYLDAQADELPPVKSRDPAWRFPDDDENALGAWYVKASIKERDSGPLHGKKIVVKDNIFVAGIPMMVGSTVLEGFVPDYDATVVARMLDAGAEIVGKAVCECFCLSGGSSTAATGPVRNPHNPAYSTGGSSSGSTALVVAGEVDMALGTDQGGSVRTPASWTGAYGMKATRGVVPFTGGMVMETSIDDIGPITANVLDNALLLDVLAGNDIDPRTQIGPYTATLGQSIQGLKIGVVKEGFNHPLSEADVDECVRSAADRFSSLGASVEEISIAEHLNGTAIWAGVVNDGFWQSFKLNGLGYNYEGVYSPALHEAMRNWSRKFPKLPVNAKMFLLLGKYLERYNGYYYAKAKNLVRRLRAAYDKALADCDLLLMPTTVQKSSRNPEGSDLSAADTLMAHAFNNTINTCQFNVTGHPALSLPCGIRDGMPVGLMLVGKTFAEKTIYQAAYAFEQSLDWTEV